MTEPPKKRAPFFKQSAFWAVLMLAAAGIGLQQKPSLIDRTSKVVQNPELIQGKPINSAAPTPQKRELPEGANLQELAQAAPAPTAKEGHEALTFDQLADFDYPVTLDGKIGKLDDGSAPSIPDKIKDLNLKKVSLSGYMMPLDMKDEKVTYFLLVRNQLLCCYGQEPKVNEYAIIVMNEPAPLSLDLPVTVSGELQVGEVMQEDMILCVYRMAGESLEVIKP